jgi:hypothetical protein
MNPRSTRFHPAGHKTRIRNRGRILWGRTRLGGTHGLLEPGPAHPRPGPAVAAATKAGPQHLDHLVEDYQTGEIVPARALPVVGNLPSSTTPGVTVKPLSRVPAGARIEAVASIASIRQGSGYVRLLLQDAEGEAAHARIRGDRCAVADQVLGRPLQVGDQVQACGYLEQEPVLPSGIKTIDVRVVRAAK